MSRTRKFKEKYGEDEYNRIKIERSRKAIEYYGSLEPKDNEDKERIQNKIDHHQRKLNYFEQKKDKPTAKPLEQKDEPENEKNISLSEEAIDRIDECFDSIDDDEGINFLEI